MSDTSDPNCRTIYVQFDFSPGLDQILIFCKSNTNTNTFVYDSKNTNTNTNTFAYDFKNTNTNTNTFIPLPWNTNTNTSTGSKNTNENTNTSIPDTKIQIKILLILCKKYKLILFRNTDTSIPDYPDTKDTNKNNSEIMQKYMNWYFSHTSLNFTCHNCILSALMPGRFQGQVLLVHWVWVSGQWCTASKLISMNRARTGKGMEWDMKDARHVLTS